MKIRLGFILFVVGIVFGQKLIFSDAAFIISDKYPVFVFIYPLVILSLPPNFGRSTALILAFVTGLTLDVLNDTLGINAFALLITAYLRAPILKMIQPRQGYKTDAATLLEYGWFWAISYLTILFIIHTFSFYSIDAFTLFYFKRILISTLLSSLVSIPFGLLIFLLFNPR